MSAAAVIAVMVFLQPWSLFEARGSVSFELGRGGESLYVSGSGYFSSSASRFGEDGVLMLLTFFDRQASRHGVLVADMDVEALASAEIPVVLDYVEAAGEGYVFMVKDSSESLVIEDLYPGSVDFGDLAASMGGRMKAVFSFALEDRETGEKRTFSDGSIYFDTVPRQTAPSDRHYESSSTDVYVISEGCSGVEDPDESSSSDGCEGDTTSGDGGCEGDTEDDAACEGEAQAATAAVLKKSKGKGIFTTNEAFLAPALLCSVLARWRRRKV